MCLSEERGQAFEEGPNRLARTAFTINNAPGPRAHFRPEGTRYKRLRGHLIIDGVKRKNAHSIREFLNESNKIGYRFAFHTSKSQIGRLPQIVSYPHSKRSFDCGSMQCHLKVWVHLADLRKAQRTITKGGKAWMVGVKNQSDFRVSQGTHDKGGLNVRWVACNAYVGPAFPNFGEYLLGIPILAECGKGDSSFGNDISKSRFEFIPILKQHDIDRGYLELIFILQSVELPDHIVQALEHLLGEVVNDLSGFSEFDVNFLFPIDKRAVIEMPRKGGVQFVQNLPHSGAGKLNVKASAWTVFLGNGLTENFELT